VIRAGPAVLGSRRWPRAHVGARAGYALGLSIAVAFLVAFFVAPLGMLVGRSFGLGSDGRPTAASYVEIFGDPTYLRIIGTTFRLSMETTLITLLASYPLAAALARTRSKAAAGLLILVVVPYFTSALVRTYAWMVLLGREGLVNQLLIRLGIVLHPLRLLYQETGVLIGLVYIFVPFMVLVLFSVMRGIDADYLRAAASAGAGPLACFRRVYLPLSMPGVVAGCLLTFVMSVGAYITPALMGGPRQTMIAMAIQQQLEQLFNWSLSGALAVVLLIIVVVAFVIYERFVGMASLFEGSL
jgi:putative spermidine/putrescine transport system permease protein